MARAITRKEARRNLLAEWLLATVRFVQARRTTVVAALIAVALLGLAGSGYWLYRERQETDAARALVAAYATLRGEPPEKPGVPDEAMKRFRDAAERYRGSRSGEEALLALGNVQYEAGKMDEAVATYSEYLAAYPRGRFRILAGLGKAYGQEAKGDLQGAAQTLSALLDRDKDNPLAGEVHMSLGRIYEGLKKPDDAMRVYEQVVQRFSHSTWAEQALQRMSALKSK